MKNGTPRNEPRCMRPRQAAGVGAFAGRGTVPVPAGRGSLSKKPTGHAIAPFTVPARPVTVSMIPAIYLFPACSCGMECPVRVVDVLTPLPFDVAPVFVPGGTLEKSTLTL